MQWDVEVVVDVCNYPDGAVKFFVGFSYLTVYKKSLIHIIELRERGYDFITK
ncbi:unnamed protein product [marine sediment metagenome]|uniref:Uncharacterized protein n=1 Tax=marine sediment metagenome TaxID=412755 RepID=X1F867_9ZZZZ